MIFKKGENLSLADLKEKYPEEYFSLMEEANKAAKGSLPDDNSEMETLRAENEQLKKDKARIDCDARIRKYGKKLNVEEKAEECVKKEMSFDEALVELADANSNHVKKVKDSFDDSSSTEVGTDTNKDKTVVEPDTFAEAIKLIKSRDNCSRIEAANKAKTEFKEIFDAQYENINNIE